MTGMSSLNSNAEPYVPPSKRDSKNDENQNLVQSESENLPDSESWQVRNNFIRDETVVVVDIADVDIEYIKLAFPDLVEHFIRDVYLANDSDLNDTIDMLYQLETVENVSVSVSTAGSASPQSNSARVSASSTVKNRVAEIGLEKFLDIFSSAFQLIMIRRERLGCGQRTEFSSQNTNLCSPLIDAEKMKLKKEAEKDVMREKEGERKENLVEKEVRNVTRGVEAVKPGGGERR
ncbi:hypothetical protein VNO78_00978 [Psophocarpus tetragonolobus]|uniref:CUE domain-containing protein n=1 Tax=Psophocarpus tetragonolobus TaxID=3891 RepID=A0AAN9XUE7_PSOTE